MAGILGRSTPWKTSRKTRSIGIWWDFIGRAGESEITPIPRSIFSLASVAAALAGQSERTSRYLLLGLHQGALGSRAVAGTVAWDWAGRQGTAESSVHALPSATQGSIRTS